MAFNPNELVLEKIRSVEEYDPATMAFISRYTSIEQPVLRTSANGVQVTDAMGAEIVTFYNAQQGTFSFTNSLHSFDLMASQFGAKKEVAGEENEIEVPVSEIVSVVENEATLSYVPTGTSQAEFKYVTVINDDNTFGKVYEVSSSDESGKFVITAAEKKIKFNEADSVTGRVFVQYWRKSQEAVKITKKTDGVPEVRTLKIDAIFHDPCNTNVVYAGVIYVPRAQINPESVELNLTPDGKHSAEYRLQKPYCDDAAKLFDIIITKD